MQWGNKMKGSSVLQNILKGMSSLQKGCVTLFYSQVGKDKLSLQELNKGTLVYSQAEGQGPPGKAVIMIIITKATKKQVRETVSNMESELASSLQQLLTSALVVACRVFHCCMGTLSCGPWDLVP